MGSTLCTLALAWLALGTPSPAQEPPKPPEKPAPAKPVYDEQADAKRDIAAALERARKENRRVLIQWGANWCDWCRRLHELCARDKGLSRELLYEYDLVRVDVGRWDKSMDLAERYGADLRKHGIPFLTVLDARGQVLVNQETSSFETQGEGQPGHDPKKLLEFLKAQEAPHLAAGKVYDAALERARLQGKRVFLHFGAPWCGWCHRLEDWMAQPQVAALLAKEFVDLKIDVDRMIGASELQVRFPRSKDQGIPWFVFLDAAGKELIDSSGPDGNTGFPYEDKEIAHFERMLRTVATRLSEDDIAVLTSSLRASRKKP